MAARQRHHPTTALIEVDAGARLQSALRPLWEQVCRGPEACLLAQGGVIDVHGGAAAPARESPARPVGGGCWVAPSRAGQGSGTRGGRRALSLYIAARHTCPAHRQPRLARLE